VVEVRAQEHGNDANTIKMQGPLDELSLMSVFGGTWSRKSTPSVMSLPDHVKTSLRRAATILPRPLAEFPDHAVDLG
jgi:hypothetical protein